MKYSSGMVQHYNIFIGQVERVRLSISSSLPGCETGILKAATKEGSMETRQLGRTCLCPGRVGLGVEHLNGQPRDTILDVITHALECGINYLDLIAWTQDVQECVGEAIYGHRDQVILAGHLGMAETDGQYRRTRDLAESQACLEAQLQRLGTDYLDLLFCPHNCDEMADLEAMLAPGGMVALGRRLRETGATRYLGFSGHTASTALRVLEAVQPDVLMFPINPAITMAPDAGELLTVCQARGVGVVAMKTYGGGTLFQRCPNLTALDCLIFALDQPGVDMLVVGCRTVAEVDTALSVLDLPSDGHAVSAAIATAREALRGHCTYCRHCEPCPVGINVAQVNLMLTQAEKGLTEELRAQYAALEAKPSDCIRCEACSERCPFGVEAADNIRRAAQLFA